MRDGKCESEKKKKKKKKEQIVRLFKLNETEKFRSKYKQVKHL